MSACCTIDCSWFVRFVRHMMTTTTQIRPLYLFKRYSHSDMMLYVYYKDKIKIKVSAFSLSLSVAEETLQG